MQSHLLRARLHRTVILQIDAVGDKAVKREIEIRWQISERYRAASTV